MTTPASTSAACASSGVVGPALDPDAPAYRPPSQSKHTGETPHNMFFQFGQLGDDLQRTALSFVADVPFEGKGMDPCSTLTHALPLVSRHVRSLCAASDPTWWRDALRRLVRKEAYLWEEGLRNLIGDLEREARVAAAAVGGSSNVGSASSGVSGDSEGNSAAQQDGDDEGAASDDEGDRSANERNRNNKRARRSLPMIVDEDELVTAACAALRSSLHPNFAAALPCGMHQLVFRSVVERHLRYTSPVFYMPGSVRLGHEFGLHFFEPRYRVLIGEVMGRYPERFRRGDPITLGSDGAGSEGGAGTAAEGPVDLAGGDEDDAAETGTASAPAAEADTGAPDHPRGFPSFIYANHSPLRSGTPACIVEVRQCLIHPNGTADVFLVPASYVTLERVWERPNSGGLVMARVLRMKKEEMRSLERTMFEQEARRRQEEMDRLGAAAGVSWGGAGAEAADNPLHELLRSIAAQSAAMEGAVEDDSDDDDEEEEGGERWGENAD